MPTLATKLDFLLKHSWMLYPQPSNHVDVLRIAVDLVYTRLNIQLEEHREMAKKRRSVTRLPYAVEIDYLQEIIGSIAFATSCNSQTFTDARKAAQRIVEILMAMRHVEQERNQ